MFEAQRLQDAPKTDAANVHGADGQSRRSSKMIAEGRASNVQRPAPEDAEADALAHGSRKRRAPEPDGSLSVLQEISATFGTELKGS